MAKTSINLLPRELQAAGGLQALTKISLAIVGVYIIILLAIAGIYYFFTTQEKNLEAANASLTTQIQKLKDKEGLFATLKNRVVVSRASKAGGQSPATAINSVLAEVPQDIQVSNIKAQDNGDVTFVARTKKSKAISDFIKNLKNKKVATVNLTSFSLSEVGDYVFAFEVVQ